MSYDRENYNASCGGCTSEHMPLGETWNTKNMYRPSNFNPFVVSTAIPYGPPGGGGCVPSGYQMPHEKHTKEGFYASSSSSWTTCGNVTPANGITYGTHMTPHNKEKYGCDATAFHHLDDAYVLPKEGYCCGATPYTHLNNAYKIQKPYKS